MSSDVRGAGETALALLRKVSVRAAAIRVQVSQREGRWRQPGALRWLLIEQLGDGTFKQHLSNLPEDASLEELVRLAHQRWAIEQNYQQLKEELGLDHFEGRSWRGLHHHLTLCFLAFCFLTRLRTSKKLCSLPEVRRWPIEALSLCLCPHCQTCFSRSGIILDTS
jgi:SRSO17 transposase